MKPITITATLKAGDVAKVSFLTLLLNPISLGIMAMGPALLAFGLLSHSEVVTRLGTTTAWLFVLVPFSGLLGAMYNAYRPGSGAIYVPVTWSFTGTGVRITQPDRDARAEWKEFTGWRSVAGCLLLHTSPTHYVVIPWRDVPAAERTPLKALLEKHLGRRKR